MFILRSGIALVLLTSAAATFGQVSTKTLRPPAKPFASVNLTSAIVTIGDGVKSKGRFVGNDETPFLQALAKLPDGGTIVVGHGTYTFSAPVTITSAIRMQGSGVTIHASDDASTGVFEISADGVTLSGIAFRQDAPINSQSLIRVTGSGLRLRDCVFHAGDGQGMTPTFILLPGPPLPDGIHDIWIESNQFHPHRGWTVIRAENIAGMHVLANNLIGGILGGQPGTSYMRYGVYCHDVAHGEIRGNTFVQLGTGTEPVKAAIFSENELGEGHHLIIANNTMHTMAAERVIYLRGSQFNVVTGNSIGRILGSANIALLEIDRNTVGGQGTSTTISSNEFHNGSAAPMIRINGGSGYHIAANHFNLVNSTCITIGDAEPAFGVSILSNEFVSSTSQSPYGAINIQGGSAHAILSNLFHRFASPAAAISGVPASNHKIDGNFEQ